MKVFTVVVVPAVNPIVCGGVSHFKSLKVLEPMRFILPAPVAFENHRLLYVSHHHAKVLVFVVEPVNFIVLVFGVTVKFVVTVPQFHIVPAAVDVRLYVQLHIIRALKLELELVKVVELASKLLRFSVPELSVTVDVLLKLSDNVNISTR